MAYCIVEEEQTMISYNELDTTDGERDFSMNETPTMQDPLYLSPEEDDLSVRNNRIYSVVDFSDPSNGEKLGKYICSE